MIDTQSRDALIQNTGLVSALILTLFSGSQIKHDLTDAD